MRIWGGGLRKTINFIMHIYSILFMSINNIAVYLQKIKVLAA